MDFAEALEADELWGWPVDVLDHLLQLRQQAWRAEISIEEWRAQDALGRTDMPVVDASDVKEFQVEFLVNAPLDMARDDRSRLVGRLTVLAHPAPTDDELWDELESLHEHLADPKHDRKVKEAFRADVERIAAWLTRPGNGIDAITGLPWSQIAHYRTIDVPGIGTVPQFVDSARQLAMTHAAAVERGRANMLTDTQPSRRIETSLANLNQEHLTWLPRLLIEAAEDDEALQPLLTDMTRIWHNPTVQQLLIGETSRGWPSPFDRATEDSVSDE